MPEEEKKKRRKRYPCTICMRVSDNIRSGLDADAEELEISVSDVAREVLEKHYRKEVTP